MKNAETCDQHKICFKQDVNKVYHSFSAKAILSYVYKIASTEIAKKLTAAWIPGLNAVSTIFAFIQAGTIIAGVNGVCVIVDLEYSSVYIHKEGHDMYGWDITGGLHGSILSSAVLPLIALLYGEL